jgi:GABA(A) receptor-associated protein
MKKIFKYFLIYIYNKMLVLEKYLKNNNVVFQFKIDKTLNIRKTEAQNMYTKYPDKVPVIIASSNIKLIKSKFLVNNDMTFGQLVIILKKYVELSSTETLYLCTSNYVSIKLSSIISETWERYRDEDGFLYLILNKENTFG